MAPMGIDARNKKLDQLRKNEEGHPWPIVASMALVTLMQCRPDDRVSDETFRILAEKLPNSEERLKVLRAMIDIQVVKRRWWPIFHFAKHCSVSDVAQLFSDFMKGSMHHRPMSLDADVINLSYGYWFYTSGLAALAARCRASHLIVEMADDPAICVVGVMFIALECEQRHCGKIDALLDLYDERPPKKAEVEAVLAAIERRWPKWKTLWGIGALWDVLTVETSKYTPIIHEKSVIRKYLKDVGVTKSSS